MSLQLYVSHSLNDLAQHFCKELDSQPKTVFQPIFIITQTEGMNTWLKYQVADRMGIAANYRYIKSQDIINQVYFLLGGKSSDTLSAENLSWILFKLLGEDDFKNKFKTVSDYYKMDAPDREVKRMALAEKIADLFDQYQIYRAEMIEDWNKHLEEDDTDDWQQWLWKNSKLLLGDKLPDKTNISEFIIKQLKDTAQQQKLRARIPVIYLFGLSITTSYHLQLYHAIGQCITVKFHLVNPAPAQYWFEDMSEKQLAIFRRKGFNDIPDKPTGNPLLTSLGKVLQDTYSLLFQYEELLNSYEEVDLEQPSNKSLLQKIQTDIFLNNSEISFFDENDCKDVSVTINACFGPAREVEVLYNYLVQLVHKQPKQLSPKDIVVMVTDINAYAPYIKAIFDNAPFKFRYSLTDESYVTGDTISAALESLLSINEEIFTAEKVVQLLDSSFIRKRFGITEVALIREVINKANIRFGTKNSFDDESAYVSWIYGLKRIMYGICLSGEAEYGTGAESFYPLDIVEGNASEQLVRFNHFVHILMDAMEKKKTDRSIQDWVEYVQGLLDNFISEPEVATNEEYLLIIKQLEAYNALNDFFTEEVSFQVFAHSFSKMLGASTTAGSFASSGITFCSLIPMRSIPFKVVAMLGMNFDKFPRKDNPVSFNLMEKKRRKGDRNIKGNDKHLFLETLLAAQENLYISYVGQSAKDNTTIPPSALVDELIDYIQTGSGDTIEVREVLVKKHPLHGFSRQYNQQDERLITYLNTGSTGIENIIDTNKEIEPMQFDEISLDAMIRFFKNPFKGYYNNVLKIFYQDEEELIDENEIFELDHLQQWALKQSLLLMDDDATNTLKDKLVKTGQLPLKNMADVTLENIAADIADVKTIFTTCIGKDNAKSESIEIKLTNTTIKGNITNIYGDKMVVISFSSNECKYLLEAYIKSLAACAAGLTVNLHYISAKKNGEYIAAQLTKEEALSKLEELVDLYKQGHKEILMFYPDFKIAPAALDELGLPDFFKAVKDVVTPFGYDCDDNYLLKEYANGIFNKELALKNFKVNCELLLKPLAQLFPSFYNN
jgi:exodeoxyribonuclease V gamma subunit